MSRVPLQSVSKTANIALAYVLSWQGSSQRSFQMKNIQFFMFSTTETSHLCIFPMKIGPCVLRAPCWNRNQTWWLSPTRMLDLLSILIESDFPKCQIARREIETSPWDGERAKWPLSCRKEDEKYREVHSIPANGRYFYLLDYPQDLWCWWVYYCGGNVYFGILWLPCTGGIPLLIL